jgi:hypothetical protein
MAPTAIGIGIGVVFDGQGGGGPSAPLPDPWLLLFSGESNSGGFAVNADASAGELAAHADVQILNNTGLVFENLDVGTNNLIGHFGLSDNATHGWEIGLANDAEADLWGTNPVYLVKTGQGGSVISQWNDGGTYDLAMEARVDAALGELSGTDVQKAIWVSFGINNALTHPGLPSATWKPDVQAWITRLRAQIGDADCTVVLTELPVNAASKRHYKSKLYPLARADANAYLVQTSDLALQGDGNHWTYAAMKTMADRMRQITLGDSAGLADAYPYSGGLTPVTWEDLTGNVTDAGSGQLLWSGGASPSGARGTVTLDATKPFEVRISMANAAISAAIILELSETTGNYVWNDGDPIVSLGFHFGGNFSVFSQEGGAADHDAAFATFPVFVRIRSDHTDLIYEKSTDGGGIWTTIYEHNGRLDGLTTLYLKCVNAAPGSGDTITVSYGQLA